MPFVLQPARPTRWGFVVNPIAGNRYGPQIANELKARYENIEPHQHSPAIHLTAASPQVRSYRIKEWIHHALKSKAPDEPVGVLAFGGDGTINDTLLGILFYLFPEVKTVEDLYKTVWNESDNLNDLLQSAGIYLGTVGLGSACDIARLYGAPLSRRTYFVGPRRPSVDEALNYLENFSLSHLNMGMIRSFDENNLDTHHLFTHSFSAGITASEVFDQSSHLTGRFALQFRKILGAWRALQVMSHLMNRYKEPLIADVHYPSSRNEDGIKQNLPMLEVVAHNLVSMAQVVAFPGTPQPGVGVKLLPDTKIRTVVETVLELFWRGLFDLSRLTPHSNLASLNNIPMLDSEGFMKLQDALHPGQAVSFALHDGIGISKSVPAQVDGDSIGRVSRFEIKALNPYPNFLTNSASVMSRLSQGLDF